MDNSETESDDSLSGSALAKAKQALSKPLKWAHSINSAIKMIEPKSAGKRTWAEMAELETEDFTSALFKVMKQKMKAGDVREICEEVSLKYPEKKDYSGNEAPLNYAIMSLSMMAWTYYSTDDIKIPNLE